MKSCKKYHANWSDCFAVKRSMSWYSGSGEKDHKEGTCYCRHPAITRFTVMLGGKELVTR